ncbi:MAG: DNA-binding response regulator [Candidatus Riflebacteria bacterium HGW-Riflebacteria-2]|jgi:DNA-binding NarL/FixJ family response regulator|nr:MAG: DNA-binding response regulator [Candidatus Riflebacteria bacterium HGW-Riflebacteria-2]
MTRRLPDNKGALQKRRIFLVDDHPLVRMGISLLINQENDLEVVGEAANIEEAVAAVTAREFDMMIVDIALGQESGLSLIARVVSLRPTLPVLVVSMHEETIFAERAIRAGAKGYIMKKDAPQKILTAIRDILNGRIFLNPDISARMIQKSFKQRTSNASVSLLDDLSPREREVLRLIGQGLKTAEIAESLCLSPKTIETYREKLKTKLGLKNASELARFAFHADESPEKS